MSACGGRFEGTCPQNCKQKCMLGFCSDGNKDVLGRGNTQKCGQFEGTCPQNCVQKVHVSFLLRRKQGCPGTWEQAYDDYCIELLCLFVYSLDAVAQTKCKVFL